MLAVVAAAALVAAVVVAVVLSSGGRDRRSLDVTPVESGDATYEYVIPRGTGDRMDAGEAVDVIPAELTVHVGEVLRLVNEDDRAHTVGPYFVAAGQTLAQRFGAPGELIGACSVHPDGTFVLTVLP